MAEQRRGLGRGLSALLEEAHSTVGADQRRERGVSELAIEHLQPNPDQPRKSFDEGELDELAASVAEHGVLQPILVRPLQDRAGDYQIVAGERRWRAAQKAGLRAVPVLVRELAVEEVMEIALIENVQRTDLNPLEEARGYQSMIDRFGRTAEAIGRAVGKSRSHIANTVRLLRLAPGVRAHLEAGRLSAGHARALLDHPAAETLADRIVEHGLSVRQTEALARQQAETAPGATKTRPEKDADTRAVEANLADVLGMAVEIRDRGGAGELIVRYKSLEQLDELCSRLESRRGRAS
ncbi:MAG TPA: ParB/RepB/Spo0J family partition protein [Caulobacteraceae bacterium]|jgi:ParB family chromosome partitioning protein|nr:ParB/RepB/Spo0J family partition protein [Caulobacteraceae bacterium]